MVRLVSPTGWELTTADTYVDNGWLPRPALLEGGIKKKENEKEKKRNEKKIGEPQVTRSYLGFWPQYHPVLLDGGYKHRF